MGTSGSSSGPGPNVPLVPPWVPPLTPPDESTEPEVSPPTPPPLAPSGRFYSTRLNLGRYASSGDRDSLTRGVGHYFKSGYGGGGTATARFGGTAKTAGALYGALSGGGRAQRTPERDALEAAIKSGAGTEKVIEALIEAIKPVDGTQDAEANRKSLADALSELMTKHPAADLLTLTPEQLTLAMALFVANDVYARFFLDVGKAIIEHAPSVSTGLSRLKEVKEYIREVVIAEFKKLTSASMPTTRGQMVGIVSTALRDAIDVFEGYAT
jgi:hypothetical protein